MLYITILGSITVDQIARTNTTVRKSHGRLLGDHFASNNLGIGLVGEGKGILFTVFSGGTPEEDKQRFTSVSVHAQALRRNDYAIGIPLALITDLQISEEDRTVFDYVILSNRSRTKQNVKVANLLDSSWHGLWHISSSPFQKTAVIPGNTAPCVDMNYLFAMMDEYDVLLGGSTTRPYIDPSLIFLKKGSGFSAFIETLERILPMAGAGLAMDLALRTLNVKCRAGVLSPNGFFGPSSIKGSLSAGPGTVHMVATSSFSTSQALCASINSQGVVENARTVSFADHASEKMGRFTIHTHENKSCVYFDGCEARNGEIGHHTELWKGNVIPFGKHSRRHHEENLAMAALRDQLNRRNLSYGISFFGYSTDADRLDRYIKEVENAAWGCKLFNPGIDIVLFTNSHRIVPRPPFHDIVHMRDEDIKPFCCKRNETWNIMARVQYHRHSPYNLTVQIDSDREVYGDLSPLFQWLADDYDVLGVSAGELPSWDLGVFGLRKGPAADALLRAWEAKMKELGHEGLDDQYSFTRVRDRIPDLKVGFLSPRWQLKYGPPKGLSNTNCNGRNLSLCNMTRTLVMKGPVIIGAGNVYTLDRLLTRSNEVAASRQNVSSVFVHDLIQNKYLRADSQLACDQLTRGQCSHPEIDWESPQHDVLSLEAMKAVYPQIKWDVA